MILNLSLKDHIINITYSPPKNPMASKKHKKFVKEDKIQETKLIRKDPEEFQELDNEIISKIMKLKSIRPMQVPIYIGVHTISMSYGFCQDPPVLEQAESNIESTMKNKGKHVLDFHYLDTESSESETTPTVSSQKLLSN
jgi:hypothetical protein